MAYVIDKYIDDAKAILEANWTGSYTMPAPGLYPHQWNWDSGFAAIGYSRFDTERAASELTTLFEAQWTSGMLPQIVFDRENLGSYFPEPDFWQTERSPDAPKDRLTSGITMPPIHALAALKVYENAADPSAALPFLEWIYPRLLKLHRYLYRERDPDGTGLVYIRHPWESGMDNSPMWDKLRAKVDLSSLSIPEYHRRDLTRGVDAGERPADKDYDYFVYLVDLFRRLGYDEKAIRRESPFVVCGPLFNAVLAASNEALMKIAEILHEPWSEQEEWFEKTGTAISERLYHEEHGVFDFLDMTTGELLEVETAAGFMPLFSGSATTAQAERLYRYLNSRSFCALHQGNCFSIPNYDTQKEGFERSNYWRGPIWININWMLMHGLRRYGFPQKADSVAKDILELPVRFDFYEYYDSFDGRGYGSRDFSWTAALFIDTAYGTYAATGRTPLVDRIRKKLWGDIVLNEGETSGARPERMAEEMLSRIKDIKAAYYTEQGSVDYEALGGSREYREYKKLATGLRDFDPSGLTGTEERLAFWINLYNTIVVDGIIALGINKSVKEVIGFFTRVKYLIGGMEFSPDDMEHGVLRANSRPPKHVFRQFGPFDERKGLAMEAVDPRVHFALVCGSRSCAPIKFYTPEAIDRELETATVNFVNSSEVIVIPEEKKLLVSSIFDWYRGDFGGRAGVVEFIGKYLVDDDKREFLREEKNGLSIGYLYYDWNLNK